MPGEAVPAENDLIPLPFSPLQAAVEAALVCRGFTYTVKAVDGGVLTRFGVNGPHGPWIVEVTAYAELERILVWVRHPVLVSTTDRREVALLLTRFNDGLHLGNFELSMDTGEARFKLCQNVESSAEAASDVVDAMIAQALQTGDLAYEAIGRVAWGECTGARAFADSGWPGGGSIDGSATW